ncbi:hypothetical protein [Haloterrigena turkmenica]|uniref:hypothetical protein n=1 Tax=Haloterrigena turkmenica TaxID=62320 RepID=UPI000A3F9795|nr:hypothetical protein [Haloterrigena turkmenica]
MSDPHYRAAHAAPGTAGSPASTTFRTAPARSLAERARTAPAAGHPSAAAKSEVEW